MLSMLVTDRSKRCRQVWRLQQIQQNWEHSCRVQQRRVEHAWLVLHESSAAGSKGIHLWVVTWFCSWSNIINIITLCILRGRQVASSDSSLCLCSRYWCDRCLQLGSIWEWRILGRMLLCRRLVQCRNLNVCFTQHFRCLHDSCVQFS